tara:strand:- start:8641 stop:11919 length:3279 start_codon:yes stop_codon:yes gene_type:complete
MKFAPLLILLLSMSAQAGNWVVEFKTAPSKKQLNQLKVHHQIELFDNIENDYFKRAYLVESDSSVEALRTSLSTIVKVEGIEAVTTVESLSVKPAGELSRHKSDDQLLSYQWGLVSQGQEVRRDKDDINYVMIKDEAQDSQGPDLLTLLGDRVNDLPADVLASLLASQPKAQAASDINFVGFLAAIKTRPVAKEVKVAVLDSGIDFGHPDLKNVIAKNLVECNSEGNTDYETRDDNDQNGVPGDCLGWNFTVHKSDPRAKLPMDDAGHGTHVAGIIAAEANNQVGVSGLGTNIKIVPVKVLHKDESSEEARQIAFTDRVARGILYAVKREVDVINLSLGWLRQSDTKYLREAVNAALARGIPVIAAAGNNGSNARLFPCSYPGVICVGATTIAGKKADFSNHGGNVDIFAPGDNILSTWPVTLVPLDFSVHGNEIQSGTSQATPFVSGVVAQLKAQLGPLSLPEIQARLMLSSQKDILKTDEKLGLSGRLDMAKALSVEKQPALRPVFKSLDEISYTLKDRKFRVPLPIVNYWQEASDIRIKLSLQSPGIELSRDEFIVAKMEEAKSITIPVDGRIIDLKSDRTTTLKVEIESNDKKETYYHVVNFVRLLIDDPEVESKGVAFLGSAKPLVLVENGELTPLITTLESFYGTAAPEWFLRRNTENGVEFSFFKASETSVEEVAGFKLDGAKRILGINSLDFNGDNIDDRFVRSTAVDEEGNENAIVYSFRNKKGEPLFAEYSDWTFKPDVVVANETLAYTKAMIGDQMVVPSPVIVSEGVLPEHQQPTGFFDERDEATRKRIYILDPQVVDQKVELKTIALDTRENIEKWREQLGLRWSDPFKVSTILAPTLQEHQSGIVRVLISGGHASRRVDAVLSIKSKTQFELAKVSSAGIRAEDQQAVRVSEMSADRFARHERTGFIGFYDGKRARTSVIGSQVLTQPYALKDEFDSYTGHIASFLNGENLTSVYTSASRLILVQDEGQERRVLERPLERFDFLPGQVFNELFWPIAREDQNGDLFPSLYVDASSIHTNSVHVIEVTKDGILAPMEQSVLLPPNCKPLNPVILPSEKAHRTTMICVEKERGFVFKFVK